MTRFARAKGSKASNERLPEEATPWSEMKQQLLEKNKEIEQSKKKQAFLNQRNANYKAFLEEKTEDEMKKSQWAEFSSENITKNGLLTKNNKYDFDTEIGIEESEDEAFTSLKAKVDEVLKKSENKTRNNDGDDSDSAPEEHSSKVQISNPKIKKPKTKKMPINIKEGSEGTKSEQSHKEKQKKKKLAGEKVINKNDSNDGIENLKKKLNQKPNQDNTEKNIKKRKLNDDSNDQSKSKKIKKDKTNIKVKQKPKEKIPKEDLTEADLKKIEKKKQKRIKQLEKKKLAKIEKRKQKEEEEKRKLENGEQIESTGDQVINAPIEINNKIKQGKFDESGTFEKKGKFQATKNRFEKFDNAKGKKERDNKEHQRRKPFMPTKMIINGKEVDVDYVDGFPVKKEDAQRLKKLRKEMISKGLPRSEINVSLKLERRKAEKAFAREKKKVCFNCRTSGHNLSECPELGKDQVATHISSGICFKCGSTEHTHFECKVVRGQEFKFAQCFICNEQGHIARQCPDNQRGLYPKGGACRVCGDVTHLKKDCPKYQAEQQQIQNSLSIETIGDSNPDVLDDKNQFKTNNSLGNRRPNKIVKF